jgi:3-deoxy-manno-octulosonate cytidylyltransferase (CMP-KDO synthetase)
MNYTVIIPARLASTRLPNKPLADIAGVPMIVRVAQRVLSGASSPANTLQVVVATDSHAIMEVCQAHQIPAILTRQDHPSGSDRLAEASSLLGLSDDAIVVNVQGDEPLIDPALPAAVAALLEQPHLSMATAAHPITQVQDIQNPNVVKVVVDAAHHALYFSRAAIPWHREDFAHGVHQVPIPAPLRHIGIYAYRAGFLRQFPRLSAAPIEHAEVLEQLRALWHGYRIGVHITPHAPGPGVDTPEDLDKVRALFVKV